MKKFSNLEKLEISNPKKDMFQAQRYTTPTVPCLNQFFIYLFNIKTSSLVHSILTDQHTAEIVVNKFFNFVLKQRTMKSFKHLEFHLDLLFDREDPVMENDRSVNYDTYITPKNNYDDSIKRCEIQLAYQIVSGSNIQPYLQLLQNIGSDTIDCLALRYNKEMTAINNVKFAPFSFDKIFGYCTNIKSLKLSFMADINPPKTVVPSLESLLFEKCNLTQEIFSVVSKNCPNLKYFANSSGLFNDEGMNQILERTLERNLFISMPSTRLEQLRINILMTRFYSYNPFPNVFIKYKTANKETRYCKCISQNNYEVEFDIDENCSEIDYEKCLNYEEECMVFNIFCEAITNLVVHIEDSYGGEECIWKKNCN